MVGVWQVVHVVLHDGGVFVGVVRPDDHGVVADAVEHRVKGEGARGGQLGGIQVVVGGQQRDGGPRPGGGRYVHAGLGAAVFQRAGQVQRDILHRAVDDQRGLVLAVVLAAHHDVDPVFADGLDGGVVADVAVLRVHIAGIVLAIDEHGAVLHHVELDVVDGGGGLHIGDIGPDQRQRRQGNLDGVGDRVHGHLLPRAGADEGGQRHIHLGLQQLLQAVVPEVVLHLEDGVAAGDDIAAAQLLDVDLSALRRRDAHGMGGHVIQNGGGDLHLLLRHGLPAVQAGQVPQLIAQVAAATQNQQQQQERHKPAQPKQPGPAPLLALQRDLYRPPPPLLPGDGRQLVGGAGVVGLIGIAVIVHLGLIRPGVGAAGAAGLHKHAAAAAAAHHAGAGGRKALFRRQAAKLLLLLLAPLLALVQVEHFLGQLVLGIHLGLPVAKLVVDDGDGRLRFRLRDRLLHRLAAHGCLLRRQSRAAGEAHREAGAVPFAAVGAFHWYGAPFGGGP